METENSKGLDIHVYEHKQDLTKQSFADKIATAHANLAALAQSLAELEKAAANHTKEKELDKN